jgi:hypothetical protein
MDRLLSSGGEVSLAGAMMAIISIMALIQFVLEQEQAMNTLPDEATVGQVLERVRTVRTAKRTIINPDAAVMPPPRKFARRNWDRDRARMCVQADYLGPQPIFDDRQFERIFRVTKSVVDQLLTVAVESSPFFRDGCDATGRKSISPHVKILMGLKLLAYGVSPSAFQDYFQMGESTALLCLKELAKVVSHSEVLKESYLRPMNRSDARRAVELHKENHGGISGMIGSIDCMHVPWRNCPVAWQGQFRGKDGESTIVMEAFADYNLWFWHIAFGFPGTLNDINIWDQSPLKKAFIDGSFHKHVDFEFEVAGQVFRHLFLLADGIYPQLARFVKTIDEAIGEKNKRYVVWQEGSRKDIEQAFGVLQRKFHYIVRPIELWHMNEIKDVVECCCLLHNIMVAERISHNEVESADWYEFSLPGTGAQAGMADNNDPDDKYMQRQHAKHELRRRQQLAYYRGQAVNVAASAEEIRRSRRHYNVRQEVANRRWVVLYDKVEHHKIWFEYSRPFLPLF